PYLNMRMIRQLALMTEPGKASAFMMAPDPQDPSPEGGVTVYVASRQPVSNEKTQKEFPEFLNRLRANRLNEAFSQWINREIKQAVVEPPKIDVPAAPSRPQGSSAPRARR